MPQRLEMGGYQASALLAGLDGCVQSVIEAIELPAPDDATPTRPGSS